MNIKLKDEQREQISKDLSAYVDTGLSTLGRAPDWWEACARVHRNEHARTDGVGGVNDPGYPVFHIPLSSIRQDKLTDQICTVISKQDPYMVVTSDDESIGDAKSSVVHRVWQDADFDSVIRMACNVCTDTDLVYYRVCPRGDGGVEMSVHHPSDVIVYPAFPTGISAATIVGHRVWKPRKSITDGIKAKNYYGVTPPSDTSMPSVDETGAYRRAGTEQDDSGPKPEDDGTVELFDVIVNYDLGKGSKKYRATLSYTDRQLLAFEEYTLDEPWYFESRLIGSEIYYPTRSVGRDLLPLQDAYNYLWSMAYEASATSSSPPIFGPPVTNDQKYTKWKAGDVIQTNQGVDSFWSPAIHPNISAIPLLIEECKQTADQVAGISQNTAGGTPVDQTATAASITAQGVAVSLEARIQNFSADFPRMFYCTMQIIYQDWTLASQRFSLEDALPDPPPMPIMPPMPNPQLMAPGSQPEGIVS